MEGGLANGGGERVTWAGSFVLFRAFRLLLLLHMIPKSFIGVFGVVYVL